MNKHKIIFLDIDGVFVTGKPDWNYFHPSKLELLYNLVLKTSAKIVICSDWRIGSPRLYKPATSTLRRSNRLHPHNQYV